MKGRVVALDRIDGRMAAALVVDGRLDDLIVDPAEDGPPRPGTIFRALVDRPMKGQGGVVLKGPDIRLFLRQSKGLAQGQSLLVQVTGYAEPGKAIPVTDRLIFKSRYAIITPGAPGINVSRRLKDDDRRDALQLLAREALEGRETGAILRAAAGAAADDEVAEDVAAMAALAADILADTGQGPDLLLDGADAHLAAWRDWSEPMPDQIDSAEGAFARQGVLEALDTLRSPEAPLKDGTAWIEPTRALVAVDVNTGRDTSPAAALKANLALARELPRALRLRGLGGQITLDLAPLAKKDRRSFEQALRAAFRSDPVETALVGWTPLGHFELQRKRERFPFV